MIINESQRIIKSSWKIVIILILIVASIFAIITIIILALNTLENPSPNGGG